MAGQITQTNNFIFGFLRCDLPEDTLDIDLKIHMLRGIYMYIYSYKQDYYVICTSMDQTCPNEFPGCIDWESSSSSSSSEEEEEEGEVEKDKLEDSDWDKEIEEKDNEARALLRQPRHPLKVLTFQTRKPPVGWPHVVKT